MMRGFLKLIAYAGILAIAGLVVGCGRVKQPDSSAPPAASPTVSEYHCAMHPEVVSSKPGTCPRCKMALTKK
jgi:hypothetical protein